MSSRIELAGEAGELTWEAHHNAIRVDFPLDESCLLHSPTVKIGVDLPAAEEAGGTSLPSWADVRAYAIEAEAAGLDSVWMFDHFFNRRDDGTIQNMYESWTILSAVALCHRPHLAGKPRDVRELPEPRTSREDGRDA